MVKYLNFLCGIILIHTSTGLNGQENPLRLSDEISHSQAFVIPEDAVQGDVAGKFYVLFTYPENSDINFQIIEGSDQFSIDENGIVTLNRDNELPAGIHYLMIQSVDQDYKPDGIINNLDIDTITVKVIAESDCVFIDPDYTGASDGSRQAPFKGWVSNLNNQKQSGKAYFQKRNTVSSERILVRGTEEGTPEAPIIIAAYGNGKRPEINGALSGPDEAGIYLGSYDDPTSYIELYSFVVYGCDGIETGRAVTNIKIYDCEAYDNGNNGNFYFYHDDTNESNPLNIQVYNLIAHDGTSHGIKFQASGSYARNILCYNNGASGFKFSLQSDNNKGEYIKSYGNSNHGFSLDGDLFEIKEGMAYSNSLYGFSFAEYGTGNTVYNCLSYSNNYIGFNADYHVSDLNLKKVIAYGNGHAGIKIRRASKNVSITHSKIYSNGIGIHFTRQDAGFEPSNMTLAYNAIYNNTTYGISFEYSNTLSASHNTIQKNTINISNSSGEIEFMNNIIDGAATNYIDNQNVHDPQQDIFVDYNNDNYNLTSNAENCINLGEENEYNFDLGGNPIIGLPDIGAYEYNDPAISIAPILNDTSFNIVDTLESNTMIGKLMAENPDPTQSLSYELISGDDFGYFELNENGTLYLLNKIELETDAEFNLLVQVSNEMNLSDQAQIGLFVEHHKENAEIVDGEDPEEKPEDNQETGNTVPVCKNQSFPIYQDSLRNLVGRIIAYDQDEGQSLRYTISGGNENNLFHLNSTTGVLTIIEADQLDFFKEPSIQLDIEVTDNDTSPLTAKATVTIELIHSSKTVFIDPTNLDDPLEDGSREHPYNSWNEVSWIEGYHYVQRANTSANEEKLLLTCNNIFLGSYGTGNKPVINSVATDYAIKAYDKRDIRISGLEIQAEDAIACVYFMGMESQNNIVEKCNLLHAEYGFRDINSSNTIFRYNIVESYVDGIFSMSEKISIYYNVFKYTNTAINVQSYSSTVKIYNNVFYGNTKAVSSSYAELTLVNNIFYLLNSGDCAISHEQDKIFSDHNIFYPEQEGFISIKNQQFASLSSVQENMKIEQNSSVKDPLFVDTYNEDFTLQPESPAINSGANIGISFDLFGMNVPYGPATDIGVSEAAMSNSITSISNIARNVLSFTIYPNPSQGNVNILIPNYQIKSAQVEIYSQDGKLIEKHQLNSRSNHDILFNTNLKKGVYIIRVIEGRTEKSERLIVQ